MQKWIPIVVLGSIILGCSKDKPAETSGMEATPTPAQTSMVDVEQIRMTLLRERPDKADVIRSLSIMENGGVVVLSGTIDDERLEQQLTDRVRQMQGVRDVRSQLRTSKQQTSTAAQPKTEEEVRMLMLQERPNDSDIIRGLSITSDGGIVTLEGRVYDERMKSDLTSAAKKARGVRDVKDNLQVDQSVSGGGGKQQGSTEAVRAALKRDLTTNHDVIDALQIDEQGNAIVIKGTVPNEMTKKQIMDAARTAAGKKTVRDELEVKKKK